uniref:Uncharacterized protein n=1 Tax=Arundo donax TaxID=35708 RepID=A0A0A9BV75_ARUDO
MNTMKLPCYSITQVRLN